MQITSAEFVKSSPKLSECPETELPEYAFIGRSNVGKSSLINALTQRKSLAKTSATPGKTQLINHFKINDSWFIVDLPGYGWAQVSKKEKAKWKVMIEEYLLGRMNLACVLVLVDARHNPQKIDLEFMEWLGNEEVPFVIVFTKTDKLGKTQLDANLSSYKKELGATWEELPHFFVTSSAKKEGMQSILSFVDEVNDSLTEM
jgi:GTP-binding protein